ncbi:DUF2892 domain-containing protein [bacterium (Candidatus Blackallbacteria) CG17_big_fil_post_rev_8_21_14_2_50_48_46]|uniref:DUF2892 domain-containing protein n=1 Tax=bacterium (Candidatus Blackallbacteria) CG17_big_fil_post_rev_8_21_14_2_50_48_46 TaxID=2014261 RepID=A0A2M7G235_9BACT|nr:MAG: hypothetical protein COW64_08540 [bacterium (Candidatus Blackallbacteria) CG18_big_fil_WC_8_21_14_2_50_49_26]PIW15730.1 MAG: DUF2892 domain-containing protein [bacterium (Candidatus Blackallbacteria) CG17_big_fil_post_rev_8_21_14_2_50_48_46]PIW49232.1 MAG: DUF2892 domain-containing protein [bacterium (Candidatus Blackallbacteria) CG13_big_fil_rev_8_21_14_2_50_49_14]
MKVNEGNMDRIIRLVLAAGIGGFGMMTGSWLGLVALIPLGTALIGWCPLYQLFGLNTCPLQNKA